MSTQVSVLPQPVPSAAAPAGRPPVSPTVEVPAGDPRHPGGGVMGPRGCVVCRHHHGPGYIEPCYRCRSTFGHAHMSIAARDGGTVQVAVCGDHAPKLPELPITAKRPAPSAEGVAVRSERKVAYDRARRRALTRLREANRGEYERLLAEEVGR